MTRQCPICEGRGFVDEKKKVCHKCNDPDTQPYGWGIWFCKKHFDEVIS